MIFWFPFIPASGVNLDAMSKGGSKGLFYSPILAFFEAAMLLFYLLGDNRVFDGYSAVIMLIV